MRRRARDERGSFLILWAFMAAAVLTMAAIVIDLGAVRSGNRTAQTVADLGALAAGKSLVVNDPVAACQEAFDYVKVNAKDLPAGASMAGGGGCSRFASITCTTSTPTTGTDAVATGTGDYTITIRWPIPVSEIQDSHYSGGTDPGNDGNNQCQRMRVTVSKKNPTYFAGVVRGADPASTRSAVVRAASKQTGGDAAALLILEPTGCGALQVSGQGQIKAVGFGTKPGIIHVDSSASSCPSSLSENATNYVVFATKTPSAGLPAILASPAESPGTDGVTRPGLLSVFATKIGGTPATHAVAVINPASSQFRGVQPDPQPADVSGRGVVDTRYRKAIVTLKTYASTVNTGTWTRLSAIFAADAANAPSCNNVNKSYVVTATNVLIDCDLDLKGNGTKLVFTGQRFVTTGPISVSSGNSLTFTAPTAVIVNTTVSNKPAVQVQGEFNVNTGNATLAATPKGCVPPDNDPSNSNYRTKAAGVTNTTRLVVMARNVDVNTSSSLTRMCQTTVFMADGTVPSTDGTAITSNSYNGTLNFGGGATDWSAPNQESRPVCPLNAPNCYTYDPTNVDDGLALEDLALWTETGDPNSSARLSQIGGSGNILVTGVFFLPNAQFDFAGQATQNINRNAQFIARRLDLSGQGNLFLRPDPNDAVVTELGGARLIR